MSHIVWWVSSGHGDSNKKNKKQCNLWCAACGGQYDWKAPNRILVESTDHRNAKAPQGMCDNLVNALEVL